MVQTSILAWAILAIFFTVVANAQATGSAAAPVAPTTIPTTNPTLTIADPPARNNFDLYLLMGQSNMVGRDIRTLTAQVDNPRVLALTADGKWAIAREPMHVGGTGIGPGIPFAIEMLK